MNLNPLRLLARHHDGIAFGDIGFGPIEEEIDGAVSEIATVRFPERDFLDQSRDAAAHELSAAKTRREDLEIALADLDTRYERDRAELVEKLERTKVALGAAELWHRALDQDEPVAFDAPAFSDTLDVTSLTTAAERASSVIRHRHKNIKVGGDQVGAS